MDGADDLAAVYALQVNARDAEVRVLELALDDHEPDAFVRHLNGVSVSELMGRESSADASDRGCVVQLFAGGGGLPATAGSPPVDYA